MWDVKDERFAQDSLEAMWTAGALAFEQGETLVPCAGWPTYPHLRAYVAGYLGRPISTRDLDIDGMLDWLMNGDLD